MGKPKAEVIDVSAKAMVARLEAIELRLKKLEAMAGVR